ncbi:hypothetical protein KY329_03985 [Candidatus Woesearchaeota archaeon]|nr:hypothetical protein [Candidatus Woesearchaeota archaeon]
MPKKAQPEWVDDANSLDLVHGEDSWDTSEEETMDSWEIGFTAGVAKAENEPYEEDEDLWD